MASNNYVIQAGLDFRINSSSIKPAVDSLTRALGANPINVPINLRVAKGTDAQINAQIRRITALSSALNSLSTSSGQAATSLANVTTRLTQFGAAIQTIGNVNRTINSTTTGLNNVARSAATVSRATSHSTGSMTSFGAAVGIAAKRFSSFIVAASGVTTLAYKFVDAVKQAAEFDFEMTRLKQVGRDTDVVLGSVEKTVTKLSTSLGVSSKDLIKAATTLRQAGFNAYETNKALEVLAKTQLAPTFKDINNTTEGIIATFGIFKQGIGALEGQFSSINKVAAEYAVESSDIVEAIRRSGAAFKAAGGDLNQFMALFSAVRSTTRESAETISAGFRTIFARSERGDTIERLKNLGIELEKVPGQFVGPMAAIKALYDVLGKEGGGSLKLAKVVEEVGGIRQFEKLIPLIQEFPLAMKIYDTALKGNNSLNEDAAIAQQSLINKLTKLQESFLELFRTISKDKTVLGFLEALNFTLQTTLTIVKNLGPLVPILGAGLLFKGAVGARGFVRDVRSGFSNARFGNVTGRAKGGPIAASDTVPAMLTPGEFVVRKEAAQKIGYSTLHKMNSMGMVGGGLVQRPKDILSLQELTKIKSARKSLSSIFKKNRELYRNIPKGSKYIGRGVEAFAFKTPAGNVIRIGNADQSREIDKHMLQPISSKIIGGKKIEELPFAPTIESIFPSDNPATNFIRKRNIKEAFRNRLIKSGLNPNDVHYGNISRYNKKIVAIDPGTFHRDMGEDNPSPFTTSDRGYSRGGIVRGYSKGGLVELQKLLDDAGFGLKAKDFVKNLTITKGPVGPSSRGGGLMTWGKAYTGTGRMISRNDPDTLFHEFFHMSDPKFTRYMHGPKRRNVIDEYRELFGETNIQGDKFADLGYTPEQIPYEMLANAGAAHGLYKTDNLPINMSSTPDLMGNKGYKLHRAMEEYLGTLRERIGKGHIPTKDNQAVYKTSSHRKALADLLRKNRTENNVVKFGGQSGPISPPVSPPLPPISPPPPIQPPSPPKGPGSPKGPKGPKYGPWPDPLPFNGEEHIRINNAKYEAAAMGYDAAKNYFGPTSFNDPLQTTAGGSRARGGYGNQYGKYKQPYFTRGSFTKEGWGSGASGKSGYWRTFYPGNRALSDYSQALGNQAYRQPINNRSFGGGGSGPPRGGGGSIPPISPGGTSASGGSHPPGRFGGIKGGALAAGILLAESTPALANSYTPKSRLAAGGAGILSGGVTGGLLGSQFGAPGAAIGAVGGALVGLTMSLKNFNDELKETELRKFNEQLTKAVEGFNAGTGKFKNAQDESDFFGSIGGLTKAPEKFKTGGFGPLTLGIERLYNHMFGEDNASKEARTKYGREPLEGTIKSIAEANRGGDFNIIMNKTQKYFQELIKLEDEAFGNHKHADALKEEIKIRNELDNVILANSKTIFTMQQMVEEFGIRAENAGKIFERAQNNSGLIGQSLSGNIVGSAETPKLENQGGIATILGGFGKTGGGYDQAKQALIHTFDVLQKQSRIGTGVKDAGDFAKNYFHNTYKGTFSKEIEASLESQIKESGLDWKKFITNPSQGADSVLQAVKPAQAEAEKIQHIMDQVWHSFTNKMIETANRELDARKRLVVAVDQGVQTEKDSISARAAMRDAAPPQIRFVDQQIGSNVSRLNRDVTDVQTGRVFNLDVDKDEIGRIKKRIKDQYPGGLNSAIKGFEGHAKKGPIPQFAVKQLEDMRRDRTFLQDIQKREDDVIVNRRRNRRSPAAFGVDLVDPRLFDINAREMEGRAGLIKQVNHLTGKDMNEDEIFNAIGKERENLAKAQQNQVEHGANAVNASEIVRASAALNGLTEAAKVLANSTHKVTAAQERFDNALQKFQGDMAARRDVANTLTFGSQEDRMRVMQQEQAVAMAATMNPAQFQNMPDEFRQMVGERLNQTQDLKRMFPIFNRNRDRIIGEQFATGRQQQEALMGPANRFLGINRGANGQLANPVAANLERDAKATEIALAEARKESAKIEERLIKLQLNEIAKERAENFTNLAMFNENFSNSVDQQTAAFFMFSTSANALSQVLARNPIPNKIELVQNGMIQVLINGMETVRAIKGDLATDITARVIDQIKKDLPQIIKNMPRN